MAGVAALFRPGPLFASAALLRVGMLFYGLWQDANSAVKYTDIDYLVFTDAARFTAQGRSPYDRETYRYTPLLAWMLAPTAWEGWFSFGKVIFAVADLLAGWFILRILKRRGVDDSRALKFASIWLLNPMVATISTRGSSEGLLGVLVMALLWAVLGKRTTVAGLLLGLGVHFKIYPFIYAPAIVWWMDDESLGRRARKGETLAETISGFLNSERIKLAVVSLATFLGLNIIMFSIYDTPFLVHTYFHHVTRIDHRHNFSPYNILLYLTSAFPSTSTIKIESVAFLPQILLSTGLIPLILAKKDLATSMMAQTFAFVTFNKVCTSQYFLWYMVFLPIYLPNSSFIKSPTLGFTALALWVVSQAAWLQQGFQLEFMGRRIWLRPGKLYLFGRTASEAGQFAISHKTISRKHLTIQVESIPDGDSQQLTRRSKVTVEDLGTKTGTTIDGHKYKGEKHVVNESTAEIKMGGCPDLFRLTWHPVVLTFSFSSREMQADPFARLREDLEQLDIKLAADYNIQQTTHVVVKKRNTSKGLQALINAKYIVTDAYIPAIVEAAKADPSESSALEQNFDKHWPNPLEYLPPRGGEPVERPESAYAPDEARHDVFEGYTFIFYDKSQFDNLLAPITNGKGKALYTNVDPKTTTVDDFILYVKTEAGEKGLGSFEDGSEGRGVVVVRYAPSKGDAVEWYADFFTQVSLRLDHRPIEQKEFLEAILIKDASMLRRPLEIDPTQGPTSTAPEPATSEASSMEFDQPAPSQAKPQKPQEKTVESKPPLKSARTRRAATRRFAGFDNDDDDGDEMTPPVAPISETQSAPVSAEPEEGLFVSQEQPPPEANRESPKGQGPRSQRKRPVSQVDDGTDDITPAAAAAKRRRIEAGEDPAARLRSVESQNESTEGPKKKKKPKKEIDILEEARKRKEELEARHKAEKEDLARAPEGIDLLEIGRNQVVVPMPLRQKPQAERSLDADVASGRWDPKWNGRKNFKGFRQRGEPTGRPRQKVIVPLKLVKEKGFGIGDEYWLDSSQKKKGDESQKSGTNQESAVSDSPRRRGLIRGIGGGYVEDVLSRRGISDSSDESEAEGVGESSITPAPATRRSTRAATTQSQAVSQNQSNTNTSSLGKRSAPASGRKSPAKKPRTVSKPVEVADNDDSSDDGLRFRPVETPQEKGTMQDKTNQRNKTAPQAREKKSPVSLDPPDLRRSSRKK
ncbi:GPI mannosyltransferase 1 [Colletotrichum spinosum]|uniref:GPI mannosyltransferase 1 n=1 Tax=Colletotrichum spinosum TaxID=1347390 RepID=A0A4R8QGB9_9PEZI|nr:GPI mannosyltransferase 1 [Colletotrichum spinosum]